MFGRGNTCNRLVLRSFTVILAIRSEDIERARGLGLVSLRRDVPPWTPVVSEGLALVFAFLLYRDP